ncbi:MAG: mannose-1-phosphate guanylyltransferase [Candidatus Hydrogenedentota bacterium]
MSAQQKPIRVGVIMAGGSGERFWPVSRKSRPKQLLKLTSPDETMLGEAVNRLSPLIPSECVFVVTGEHLIDPIRNANLGLPGANILAEPAKRNTAGALVYAAACLLARFGGNGDNITMAVTTADHHIGEPDLFRRTVAVAMDTAERDNRLATLGVKPTRPETGYGYIQAGQELLSINGITAYGVTAFHEKPSREKAEDFILQGNYYWNAGMFFWTISAFLRELEAIRPEMAATVRALAEAIRAGNAAETKSLFESLENISIDYALMEHAKRVALVRADFPWDDVGAWTALDRSYPKDASGNVCVGDPVVHDAKGCIVYNEPGGKRMAVGVVGVDDLIVVVTEDAVLVLPKDRAQDVRHTVAELKNRGSSQL